MRLRSTFLAARQLALRDIPELPAIVRALRAVMPITIVGREHLLLLYRLARIIERENVPGAIVECGVFRGASAAIMASAMPSSRRPLWLFDSFQGLPEGGLQDNPVAVATKTGAQKAKLEDVARLFHNLEIDPQRVNVRPGWFKDTLSNAPVDDVALLHLDADWYESTKEALDRFLPSLSPGGFLVVDDYQGDKFSGCHKAVNQALGAERARRLNLLISGSGAWTRL